ncbi:hypothetical protein BL250_11875 [Erwinia sp. OLTSP20]|nr:hypothetical protein BV501_12105 [Erwinia sp. OAMSP11]PIJ71623.1 hypothetical protein BK416_11335 [Erwinia sp. OLSSP12]PIJ82714.1 hypothetical protein BLD47_06100 [Erwinia sp. OLCASP19]PIJ83160.1 hypothetical protein BLD46_10195 [Erwinia sp. OLMTSP26]PIJ85326.1 hypothetical protein BLD49_10755 [Erwinia sp. OLMDSP33]PIJ89969.1 hypothetical protein BL249_14360 [Erwinia sp. OLFS4]PIJ91868.1 hypothetical protein BL250_11875 [Erwinia sp. OLTSP20]
MATILAIVSIFITTPALAQCVLDTVPPEGGGQPVILSVPAFTVFVDADAPADRSTPIGSWDSSHGTKVSFKCLKGDRYGKDVYPPLLGQATQQRMYATKIDGLEIMPMWYNGVAFGKFPTNSVTTEMRLDYPPAAFYRVQIFKTKSQLKLNNPQTGDVILDPGKIAYNWVNNSGIGPFPQTLMIGQIRIISTPVCRLDGKKTVNFNTVTPDDLAKGVSRPLNFSMTCATDYGHYSATAKLTTTTPDSDNNYIKVTDSAGNDDRLKIRIDDSSGSIMHVDGTNAEIINSLNSNVPAQFKWTATILKSASTQPPKRGPFSASAEIILEMN